MVAVAFLESFPGAKESHSTTCVSTRIGKLAPFLEREYRRNYVACDPALADEETKDFVFFGAHRDQLGHGFPVLCDDHGFTFGMHLVHDREAFRLESTRCHLPYVLHRFLPPTMVILPWS